MHVGLSTITFGKPIQKNGMLKCAGGSSLLKQAHAQSQICEYEKQSADL